VIIGYQVCNYCKDTDFFKIICYLCITEIYLVIYNMKQRVELGKYAIFSTLAVFFIIIAVTLICFYTSPWIWTVVIMGTIISVTLLVTLYYCPLSIEVTNTAIVIHRSISFDKTIKLSDIKSVRTHTPTNALRICGNGGVLGFTGWFTEKGIGNYFAYYGNMKDCFLVELKNGRKYMLGCKNSTAMVEEINKLLQA
jgi:hypothetical protein